MSAILALLRELTRRIAETALTEAERDMIADELDMLVVRLREK